MIRSIIKSPKSVRVYTFRCSKVVTCSVLLRIPQTDYVFNALHRSRLLHRSSIDLNNSSKAAKDKEIYESLTPIQHILHRPGMYIGQKQSYTEDNVYKLNPKSKKYEYVACKEVVTPSLLKIFDEILVNASDHRMKYPMECTRIDISIDRDGPNGPCISVKNNGKGIPIYIHEKEGIYIPELLFGRLLTGSNFNDDNDRLTAGTHGYGAKLTNIFSKMFIVETTDTTRKLKYKQVWNDNMTNSSPPQITPYTDRTNYTCITFNPDLSRLMNNYTKNKINATDYNDMIQRIYDFAGCLTCSVYLNNQLIPISGFKQYISLHSDKISYTKLNNWEIGVIKSPSSTFHQTSFVNGTKTKRGGNHVDVILKQIITYIKNYVFKLDSSYEDIIKPNMHIKRFIGLFINASCINPTFDSQVKEFLTNTFTAEDYVLPTSFLKSIINEELGIIQQVIQSLQQTQALPLLKFNSMLKTKSTTTLLLPKLEDAHFAGTKQKSHDCTLILTEGDSAKALALSGLEVLGREYYGVFPLRGKFLNVRTATSKNAAADVFKNVEVKHLCQILNLHFDKKYDTLEERKTLRYGHVMLMTDQDSDGSHIKGLLMNFFRFFWPDLLLHIKEQQKPFLSCFITPLLKASNTKKQVLSFFTQHDYNLWKSQLTPNQLSKYKIKYYKGLGTSTPAEAKEYFQNFNKHIVQYKWNSEESDGHLLDMVFDKDKSEERKNWITAQSSVRVSNNQKDLQTLSYEDFINNEFINYSQASIHRSIPHVLDGFKPSQRKVLYACFLKKLYSNEIKVAQLSGYCSEQTAYHHGEASLQSTIIKMSQNFVGSNNINLLQPIGQFGTRHSGGDDAASPRYIFTCLDPICRLIFPEVDDQLLQHNQDDGFVVEPIYYIPIIPTLLINGAQGIGSGWSTSVPSFNVHDIIQCIRNKLNHDEQILPIRPFIRGFQGTIYPKDPNNQAAGYITQGTFTQHSPTTIEITELPVGKWTNDYKTFLISLKDKGIIKSFVENHTSNNISFTMTLPRNTKLMMQKNKEEYYTKIFALTKPLSLTNMYAFHNDASDELRKYTTPHEILNDFFPKRYQLYQKRKDFLVRQYSSKVALLKNKVKFMDFITSNVIDMKQLQQNKKDVVQMLLQDYNFIPYSKIMMDGEDGTSSVQDFDYLLNISLNSFTKENLSRLQKEAVDVEREYESILEKTVEDLWLHDLDELEKYLKKHYK